MFYVHITISVGVSKTQLPPVTSCVWPLTCDLSVSHLWRLINICSHSWWHT